LPAVRAGIHDEGETINIDELLRSRNIKPQHEWQWQVAVYLYLAGIGSGSMAVGILMDWMGLIPDGLRPFVLWGPIFVAVGAVFLVLKLGVKRRFLNTILNPMSSWLSRGFYILSICIIDGMIILVLAILPYLEPYLHFTFNVWPWLQTALDIIGFIFALGTAVYTGILIMSVKYVPFWDTWLLPSLFTVSALSTGAMAVMLSTTGFNLATATGLPDWLANVLTAAQQFPEELAGTLTVIEQVLIIVEIIVVGLYLFTRYRVGEYGMFSVKLLLSGRLKYFFWAGIVVCGFFIPMVVEGIYSRFHDQYFLLFTAGGFMLLGGFFIRYVTVYAGIKEEPPMLRLVESRRRVAGAGAAGTLPETGGSK
jgi:formate-dependent nitrite reductase membrane component NrfD